MTALVLRGDARALSLPDASVDLICTSPPYYALRSYTDNGRHYAGQIGDEPTPQAYVDALIECTREWMRVLKPSGSIWVNLGDKYSGAQAQNIGGANRAGDSSRTWQQTNPALTGIPNKSLIGLPWRYALACIDQLGLILRAEVIWSKPNGLPESVRDRVRRSHEQWFHMVKQPRYYAAVDRIRQPHAGSTITRAQPHRAPVTGTRAAYQDMPAQTILRDQSMNSLGALPGSVWTIPTQPLTVPPHLGVDHFAAFPLEWPRRIILGWSPQRVCTACGEGRQPTVIKDLIVDHVQNNRRGFIDLSEPTGNCRGVNAPVKVTGSTRATITGEACACPDASALTTPGVILDPFGGTGTTALVASVLDRVGISVDMSADYSRLAAWRTTDPGQRAAALQVDKPPAQLDGQDDLLTLLAGGA
jgi:DNA modification methylase